MQYDSMVKESDVTKIIGVAVRKHYPSALKAWYDGSIVWIEAESLVATVERLIIQDVDNAIEATTGRPKAGAVNKVSACASEDPPSRAKLLFHMIPGPAVPTADELRARTLKACSDIEKEKALAKKAEKAVHQIMPSVPYILSIAASRGESQAVIHSWDCLDNDAHALAVKTADAVTKILEERGYRMSLTNEKQQLVLTASWS